MIGCLGDIIFTVDSEKVLTPNNVQWSGSARHADHKRYLNNSISEFTGVDPDKMSFKITLMAELGVDVMEELVKIWTYERKATPLLLVFGIKGYGKYRWTIRSHSIPMKHFDREGTLSVADVSISLVEYMNI